MKLKEIPQDAVVHTPTEEEAKELLEILHDNGYEWYHKYAPIPNPRLEKIAYINIYNSLNGCRNVITYCDKHTYVERYITLAEFKERYVLNEDNFAKQEEEKPQPKFNKGDMVVYNGKPYTVEAVTNMGEYYLYSIDTQECDHLAALPASDLEPYTGPETKPTEDMETKELNLCELLKGHEEGKMFYSLLYGETQLRKVGHECIEIATIDDKYWTSISSDGTFSDGGNVVLFPSRALYEQYPLNPYTAWMKWREEQKKPFICIHWGEVDCNGDEEEDYTGNTYFRTPADRDKCIEEIKAIIEKYSK